MSILFTPLQIKSLKLPNRFVRSATAENMADGEGCPLPPMFDLYRDLVRGGVGLIITGHMFVHPTGKAHTEMIAVHDDRFIPGLSRLAELVHKEGGKVVAQINHGGMQCSREATPGTIAPSAIDEEWLRQPARQMTQDEIARLIEAYASAARRVKEAGFDGVQLHGAHGYLINQFLSPLVNRRMDEWGGSQENRMRFLREICQGVRQQVGDDFPMMIKLGLMDGREGGLSLENGLEVVRTLKEMGLDAFEISCGIAGPLVDEVRKAARKAGQEAHFLAWAEKARKVTDLSVMLVDGFRSKAAMENALTSGAVDFISISRPLIAEPDFPRRMQEGRANRSICISAQKCWPEKPGDGIGCKCPLEKITPG